MKNRQKTSPLGVHPLEKRWQRTTIVCCALLCLSHCDDSPAPAGDAGPEASPDRDANYGTTGSGATDANCPPRDGDFIEGDAGQSDDWPPCVSDQGSWALVADPPSSIGRIDAFEEIATLLFGAEATLSSQAFTNARVTYAQEQGLDSRIQRREDEHYPPATDVNGTEARCRDDGIPDLPQNADRCVGPAQILPILNESFAAGMSDADVEHHSARIEAALLWFLFASTYKEAATCGDTPKDCDSSWAYYTGGTSDPGELKGLARYVYAADPTAYAATWAGLMALRCWRDVVDSGTAMNGPALHQAALAQLDRGLNRGLAAVVAARTHLVETSTGPWPGAHWQAIQILGGALDRAATAVDTPLAAELRQAIAPSSPADADLPGIRSLLAQLFPCP
jgi:hypothetical protein